MALFGGMRRSLMDARTDDEKLRELQSLMNPFRSPNAASGGAGLPLPFAARPNASRLGDDAGGDRMRAMGALPAGAPVLPPSQQATLDGPWSQFDPSDMPDGPKPEALPPVNAIATAPRKGPAPWEQSGRGGWAGGLSDLGTSMMAAQAAIDGDFGTSATLTQNMQKTALEHRRRAQLGTSMRNQGYSDDQIMMALADPETIGKNFNERLGTRVVAPGSSIVTGGPNGQQATYSQPNAFEAYAAAQGLQPGTAEYVRAMQDYTLRQYGPMGIANQKSLDDARTDNKVKVEGVQQSGRLGLEAARQKGRLGLEGVRQGNRMTTRQAPTYRDTHGAPPRTTTPRASGGGAPPRVRTATGANGQKLYLRNGQWVDAQGRPVQ